MFFGGAGEGLAFRVQGSAYHPGLEGESASGSDRDARDDSDDRSSRAKRLRRVNVDDSLSAFAPKTKTKLQSLLNLSGILFEEWIQSLGNSLSRTGQSMMTG